MTATPVKYLYDVRDQRAGSHSGFPLLSVSISRGVLPRSELVDGEPRAEDLSNYKRCSPSDIVINRMSAYQGAVGISRVEGVVSPDYLVLRPRSGTEPRFLSYLIKSVWFVGEMSSRVRGIGSTEQGNVRTPRINPSDLGGIVVDPPPLREQREIADYLDTETARIDALIAKKRTLAERLAERFESSVFTAVTTGLSSATLVPSGLDWAPRIPEGWGTPTVSANFDVQLGKMLSAEAIAGPNHKPYLRNLNVQWDRLVLEDLATMHFSVEEEKRFQLRSGDLLVCEGGVVGRSAVWPGDLDCYYQKALHRVRPRGRANTRFLMYALRAAAKVNVFAVQGNLSTIVHLTREQLNAHRFPWPPEVEQERIVEHLDEVALKHQEITCRLDTQVGLLLEHRQALITAAVTGELEIPGVA